MGVSREAGREAETGGEGAYTLRDLRVQDLEQVLEWRNSERIRACMFTDRIITMDEHLGWFERLEQNKTVCVKLFEVLSQPAGLVNVTLRDIENGIAYWGFYLGHDALPKGTGGKMGELALQLAFGELNIRKLCGEVLASNMISLRFHEKLGFVQEGRLRKHVKKNGCYEDVVIYALFQEDYRKEVANDVVFS